MNLRDFLQTLLAKDIEYSARMGVAERPGTLRTVAMFFAHSGDSWFWWAGLAIVWLVGNDYWKDLSFALAVAILITALLVLLIKFSVRRQRPEGAWGGIYRKTDPHSFPSGHAARAALIAVMALSLGPSWFGLAMAVWAPFVPLARVAMGVHYLSDVLVGAFLGVLMGLAMLQWFPF